MEIRPWQPGDEVQIRALFQTVFGAEMSEAFWNWRYRDHPAGDPMVMLAWDGDRLAAHYAASFAPLLVEGEPVLAALSMTTMTHSDYRGQGLFEKTASALYDEIAGRGVQAIWGFPNRNSNIPFRAKLSWHGIADVPVLVRELREGEVFASHDAVEMDAITAGFDAAGRIAAGIRADRRHDYLAWRVDRNPLNRYIRLALPGADGRAVAGYAILKSWKDTEFDLVALEAGDAGDCAKLVAASLAAVQKRGGAKVNCWSLAHRPERIALERAGFAPVGLTTNFGGRGFGPALAALPRADQWKIDMLDSDIY